MFEQKKAQEVLGDKSYLFVSHCVQTWQDYVVSRRQEQAQSTHWNTNTNINKNRSTHSNQAAASCGISVRSRGLPRRCATSLWSGAKLPTRRWRTWRWGVLKENDKEIASDRPPKNQLVTQDSQTTWSYCPRGNFEDIYKEITFVHLWG